MANQLPQAVIDRLNRGLIWSLVAGLYFTHIIIQVAAALYLLLFIYQMVSGRGLPLKGLPLIIIVYALSGIVAFRISGQSAIRLADLLPHLVLLTLVPASSWVSSRPSIKIEKWIWGMVLFATIVALKGGLSHFQGLERASGFFGGYYGLASLMTWSLFMTTGLFLSKRSRGSWILSGSLLVQLLALWWTYTRSAFLGLYLGMFLWGAFVVFRGVGRNVAAAGDILFRWTAVLALPLFLTILILNASDPRINPLKDGAPGEAPVVEDLSSGRISIIADALEMVSADLKQKRIGNLILGYGLSSRQRLVDSPFTSWESDYLQVFMNQGMVGLIILIMIYASFLRLIWKGLHSANYVVNGVATAGIAFGVMSFFTIPLTGFVGAAAFVVLYVLLQSQVEK